MARPVVFYAWQADRPRNTTRDLIRSCAHNAVVSVASRASITDAPRLDHDTLGQSGTPPIAETIFRKIRSSAIFLADVTFTAETRTDSGQVVKRACNPNVMIELGFAVATLGWDRIILVLNKHYGGPDNLPFDLRNHRFPLTYDLGPQSERNVSAQLTEELTLAIRSCLSAEYDLVDSTLERLSAFARTLMKKYGANRMFWETTDDNKVLSRFDLAVTQMLTAGVIRCVDAATDTGVAYAWTYLGQQCCLRLGIQSTPVSADFEHAPPSVIVDHSMYDQLGLRVDAPHDAAVAEQSDARETSAQSILKSKSTPRCP